MKMKSKSTLSKEFVAKKGSKKGAVAKAMKADRKHDKAVAKKYGVKWNE